MNNIIYVKENTNVSSYNHQINQLIEEITNIIDSKPNFSSAIYKLFNSLPDPLDNNFDKNEALNLLYESFLVELYENYSINSTDQSIKLSFEQQHYTELTKIKTWIKDNLLYLKGEKQKREIVKNLKGTFLEKLTNKNMSNLLGLEKDTFSIYYEPTFHNGTPITFSNLLVHPPDPQKNHLDQVNKIDFFVVDFNNHLEEMNEAKNLTSNSFLIECKSSYSRVYSNVHNNKNQVEYLELLNNSLKPCFNSLKIYFVSYENDQYVEKTNICNCNGSDKCLQCFMNETIEVFYLVADQDEFEFESA